jgi:hypothetical protein
MSPSRITTRHRPSLRRVAAVTIAAAGALAPAAMAAPEAAPATAIDQVSGFSHLLAPSDGGGAIVIANRMGTMSWTVGSGMWGGVTPSPVQREFRAAERIGSGAVAITTDQQGMYANRILPDGGWGAQVTLSRAGQHAISPSVAPTGAGGALVAFVESEVGAAGARRDVRVAQVGSLPGSLLAFRQTVAAGEQVPPVVDPPAVASGGDRSVVAWKAVGDDGRDHLRAAIRQGGAWGAPLDLGRVGVASLEAGAAADGRLAIAFTGTDDRPRVAIAPPGGGFANPTLLSDAPHVSTIDVELGAAGTGAVLWSRTAPGTAPHMEGRIMHGGAWGPVARLGPSGVDGPGEQDLTATATGFVGAFNAVHGANDYGVTLAQAQDGRWQTSPLDGTGDGMAKLSPNVVALDDSALASWVRIPLAGQGAGEIRTQRITPGAAAAPPAAPAAPAPPAAPVDPPPAAAAPAPAPPAATPSAAPARAVATTRAARRTTPARLRVRWTRSGRTLRATIIRRADSTGYRMQARRGSTVKKARCIAKRVTVTRARGKATRTVRVRRQVCTVRLGRGTWKVSAIARKGPAITATAARTHRVR